MVLISGEGIELNRTLATVAKGEWLDYIAFTDPPSSQSLINLVYRVVPADTYLHELAHLTLLVPNHLGNKPSGSLIEMLKEADTYNKFISAGGPVSEYVSSRFLYGEELRNQLNLTVDEIGELDAKCKLSENLD